IEQQIAQSSTGEVGVEFLFRHRRWQAKGNLIGLSSRGASGGRTKTATATSNSTAVEDTQLVISFCYSWKVIPTNAGKLYKALWVNRPGKIDEAQVAILETWFINNRDRVAYTDVHGSRITVVLIGHIESTTISIHCG